MATKKVNIDIVARDKSKRALNKVRANLDGVKRSVFNLRNAFIGLGAGLAIRSLVKTGMEIENLQVRLKFLFGTAEEGAKAFDKMATFASKVPFSLQEIQQGAGVLAVVSKDADELAHIMEITGNVAAVTGLDFRTTAEQIQRSLSAGISAADLFREKGVKSMLGFKAGATVSIEETVEAFERVFGSGGKFAGATDELAKTFEGTLSMIGDKIFNFKRTILEAGFFPELKKQFGDLNKFLEANGQTLDEIAESIGKGLATSVRISANAILFLRDNFDFLVESIKLLIAFKIASVFVALAGGIMGANRAMLLFNATVKRNLFIAGAAIVISQFDKILDVLGRLPKSFDSFSEAIAENKRQIEHYTKQLGNAKAHWDDLEKKYGSSILQTHIDQIADAKSIYDETNETLKKLREESDALFKEAYPVYEDQILKLAKSLKKQKEATEADFNIQNIIDSLKKEQKAIEKQKQVYYEFYLGRRRLSDLLAKEEKENLDRSIIAHKQYGQTRLLGIELDFKKERELQQNNFHRMLDQSQAHLTAEAELKKQFKEHTISEARSTLEILAGINENAFKVFKALRIAEATINTYSAAVAAFYKFGGWPFGVIAAAATVAKGMAMVAQINAQSYSGREHGGAVTKGKPYMVGEAGREMFVPNQSGNIVPNDQLGKAVTVNFNINTVDARGFNELLVNSRGVIVNMINSAVNEKGRMAIV